MNKIDIKKLTGVSALSLALVVGVAGFAGATSGTIGTTGADSYNKVSDKTSVDLDVNNDNNLNLSNRTHQYASSGESEVKFNTTGGNAESGGASNTNGVGATIEVDNSHAAAALSGDVLAGGGSNTGSITNTGYDSHNEVKYEARTDVDIRNDNDINIHNSSDQMAKSGDAEVKYNTTGGSAVSGDVSNTSTASFDVRVTN